MINVSISGKQYTIATNIFEVDINRLVQAEGEREELAAISNIPLEVARLLDMDFFLPMIAFLNDPEDYSCEHVDTANVDEESYSKLEEARSAIISTDKIYKQIFEVSKVYHPDRKKSVPIFKTGINLLQKITLFLDEYSELTEDGPDQMEVSAGIDKINEMARFGTAFVLAGRDLTKMDQVTRMPAIVVYTALLYNHRENKYQEALYKLKYPK